jgi:hypothetical protein
MPPHSRAAPRFVDSCRRIHALHLDLLNYADCYAPDAPRFVDSCRRIPALHLMHSHSLMHVIDWHMHVIDWHMRVIDGT